MNGGTVAENVRKKRMAAIDGKDLTFAERLLKRSDDRGHEVWLEENGLLDEVIESIKAGAGAFEILSTLRPAYGYRYPFWTIEALVQKHKIVAEPVALVEPVASSVPVVTPEVV